MCCRERKKINLLVFDVIYLTSSHLFLLIFLQHSLLFYYSIVFVILLKIVYQSKCSSEIVQNLSIVFVEIY